MREIPRDGCVFKLLAVTSGLLPLLLVLPLVALPSRYVNDPSFIGRLALGVMGASLLLMCAACALMARGRGYSAWYGMAGLLWVFGPFAILRMTDGPPVQDDQEVRLDEAILPPPPRKLLNLTDPVPTLSNGQTLSIPGESLRKAVVVPARVVYVGSKAFGTTVKVWFEFLLYGAYRPVQLRVLPRLAQGLRTGETVPLIVVPGSTYHCIYDPDLVNGERLPKALRPEGAFEVIPVARLAQAVVDPPMVESMALVFEISGEQMADAQRAIPPRRGTRIPRPRIQLSGMIGWVLFIGLAVLLFIVLQARRGPVKAQAPPEPTAVMNWVGYTGMTWMAAGVVTFLLLSRLMNRRGMDEMQKRKRVEAQLAPEGICMKSLTSRDWIDWSAIDNAVETPESIVLFTPKRVGWALTTGDLSSDQAQQCRELIRRSIGGARESRREQAGLKGPAAGAGTGQEIVLCANLGQSDYADSFRAIRPDLRVLKHHKWVRTWMWSPVAVIPGSLMAAWGFSGWWLIASVFTTWFFVAGVIRPSKALFFGRWFAPILEEHDPFLGEREIVLRADGAWTAWNGYSSWHPWSSWNELIDSPTLLILVGDENRSYVIPKRYLQDPASAAGQIRRWMEGAAVC